VRKGGVAIDWKKGVRREKARASGTRIKNGQELARPFSQAGEEIQGGRGGLKAAKKLRVHTPRIQEKEEKTLREAD